MENKVQVENSVQVENNVGNIADENNPCLHGGDIQAAANHYGIALDDWLDLSTGINPYSYPTPPIPTSAWQRLPYLDTKLVTSAKQYYGLTTAQKTQLLLGAGSQVFIQHLPRLLRTLGNQGPVLLPDVGYQEHAQAWQQVGACQFYAGLHKDAASIDRYINQYVAQTAGGHLVLINPNNPTGVVYDTKQILAWAQKLASCQGFVIVDEAFMDATPQDSVLYQLNELPNNVIVLRSLGKFFGLAGLRIGALIANTQIIKALDTQLDAWAINGPGQIVAHHAWQDTQWINAMRQCLLKEQSQQVALWHNAMQALGAKIQADTPLFRSYLLDKCRAQLCYQEAAQAGILLRLLNVDDGHSLLRMGNVNLTHNVDKYRCLDFVSCISGFLE